MRTRGFTLVELLVALTIFVTVMASVALVFNGAVRSSKQGFQNQEAFELARGTQKLLERDLNRAFTNRDHGDVYTMYGTPIGFTFVGMVSADETSDANLARVTYVMYHLQPTLDNLAGAVGIYEAKEGSNVPTYQLLRYIEPGQDTLDSLPIEWDVNVNQDLAPSAQFPPSAVVDAAVTYANCKDPACDELVRQAARREVWMIMLSGGGDVDTDGDGLDDNTLPSAWSLGAWSALPTFANLDPADYVVGENIRFLSLASSDPFNVPYCAADQPALETILANNGITLDFDDILYNSGSDVCATIISNPNEAPLIHSDLTSIFSSARYLANQGARPFFTYWDVGVIPNDINIPGDDQHTPIQFQFWNDVRNMAADGLDNDGDGTVDEADEQYGENSGSPLDTRLPIAVTTDFTLFFRSPYPGAPDFNERFTQRIDLPTAYRRQFKNPAS